MLTKTRTAVLAAVLAFGAVAVAEASSGGWPREPFPGLDDGTRVATIWASWFPGGSHPPLISWEIGTDIGSTSTPDLPFQRSHSVRKGDAIGVRVDADSDLLAPTICRTYLDGDEIKTPGASGTRNHMGPLQCRAVAAW